MTNNTARAITSVAICAMGTAAMYVSEGTTGIGWAILGLFLIWTSLEIS